jgi:hypothetical protein
VRRLRQQADRPSPPARKDRDAAEAGGSGMTNAFARSPARPAFSKDVHVLVS